MAASKLSPRQRMINLMYLVFIAMMAMNMSKEVLSAFGLLNERLADANISADERNVAFLAGLDQKVTEQPDIYGPLQQKANTIHTLSSEFDSYLASVKSGLESSVNQETLDNKFYEAMDKTDYFDITFFRGNGYSEAGQEFLDKISNYRTQINELLGSDPRFAKIVEEVNNKFNTDDVTRGDGATVPYLNYHYQGFPMVASLTKLTQLQNDVKTTNSQILSAMLEGELQSQVSLSNYEAVVLADKTAFFNGENFTGTVYLGRIDKNLNFEKIIINGNEIEQVGGQVKLDFPAGNVGEQEITGELQFKEGDSIVTIPISSSYAVIPKPNAAVISADKMNVVYRGVENPMTVSIPGVGDAVANAPGLRSAGGAGKYVMNVTQVQGREVTINVSGTLPGGERVSDSKVFRIKDIPRPVGTIRGEDGIVKMQRSNLEISTVGAALIDFDFDVNLNVTEFKFNVPGQATVVVSGSRLNAAAISALKRATPRSTVQIFDIKANLVGSSGYILPRISPVFIELTN